MKIKIMLNLIGITILTMASCYAYSLPFSLSGEDDLSMTSDYPYGEYAMIDENYSTGWWNGATDTSILLSFNAGMTTVDKIQMCSGTTYYYDGYQGHTVERCHLYYTTDENPTLSSTFLPMEDLVILNGVDGTIDKNELYMNEAASEIILAFDAVDATAIKIIDHSDPQGGDDDRFRGRSEYIEVTIDGASGTPSAVPEPATIILLSSAIGFLVRKIRK